MPKPTAEQRQRYETMQAQVEELRAQEVAQHAVERRKLDVKMDHLQAGLLKRKATQNLFEDEHATSRSSFFSKLFTRSNTK